jgi:hypothetical protein
MDNRYYSQVVAGMQAFLDEQSFRQEEDGTFVSEKKLFRIEYDEKKQVYLLQVADPVEEGEPVYKTASSWLFDDSQTARDAEAVSIDFVDELRRQLGITPPRAKRYGDIALPTKADAGETPNSLVLCQKTLAIFPQFKDEYKAHVEQYGEFLCIEFFSKTLAPKLRELLRENNKKQLKKVLEMLSQMFIEGDRMVGNVIVVTILCGAIGTDQSLYDTAYEALKDMPHLQTAMRYAFERLPKDKQMQKMLLCAE